MDAAELEKRLLDALAQIALDTAKTVIPSAALVKAARIEEIDARTKGVFLPHYWAIYLHDGHDPFQPGAYYRSPGANPNMRPTQWLAWFRDPNEDPRLIDGEPPERFVDVRYLRQVLDDIQTADAQARLRGIAESQIGRASADRLLRQLTSSNRVRSTFRQLVRSGRLILAKYAPGTKPGLQFFEKPPMSTLADDTAVLNVAEVLTAQYVRDQLAGLSVKRTIVLPL